MNIQRAEGDNNEINLTTVLEELFQPQPTRTLSEPTAPEQQLTCVPDGDLMLTFKPATKDTATATEVPVTSTAVQTVAFAAPEENAPEYVGHLDLTPSMQKWSDQWDRWCSSKNSDEITKFIQISHIKYLLPLNWDHPHIFLNPNVIKVAANSKIQKLITAKTNGKLTTASDYENDLNYVIEWLTLVAKQRIIDGTLPGLGDLCRILCDRGMWSKTGLDLQHDNEVFITIVFGKKTTSWLTGLLADRVPISCCNIGPMVTDVPNTRWREIWRKLRYVPQRQWVNAEMVRTMSNYMPAAELCTWFQTKKFRPCKHVTHLSRGGRGIEFNRNEREFPSSIMREMRRKVKK